MEQVANEIATTQEPRGMVTYSVTDAEIDKLAEEFKEVPADLTVKANYEICRKATATIRGMRGDVEKRRKELKADALAWGKKVDGEAKAITEKLLAIEEPFAIAKKDFDTAVEIAKREAALAEERRVDGIADRIALIKATVNACISSSSKEIEDVMARISGSDLPVEFWAMEFAEKANAVVAETWEKLDELRKMKIVQEEAAIKIAEAEDKRKAEEEQRRKEEDLARAAWEKELEDERAKIAAERAELDAMKAKIEANEKAKEDERIAVIHAEQKEAERKQEEEEKKNLQSPATQGNEYFDAGNAIFSITNDTWITNRIMGAIVRGEIPNVIFTGKLP